ncbi:MAG: TrmJ/YjtD family RNA methyltransferase [Candidatus Delongbacteria bacterium]|nr:TrmJ/YjtD family RNA methyltransferase [Candidatus Delongbacteria bacterium]MBN2834903.1 TrmJ/YjtD family RNA methyltransferase [Candidatus Delongbacteria bacterium]
MKNRDNIHITLVRTWSPGNVGSVARAAKNFGFNSIRCVQQINFSDDEMFTMAAGAKDHTEKIVYFDDLSDAVKDSNIVYAFTNRQRKFHKMITPAELAKEISELPDNTQVSLLFGNETNGLSNEEIDFADTIVTIPTSADYSSLNLSMAVLITLYELFKELAVFETGYKADLIDNEEKRIAREQIAKIITEKIMEKDLHTEQVEENVKLLFKRMMLTKKEIGFIRSIFRLAERKIDIVKKKLQ